MKSSIASTSKVSEHEAGRAGRDLEWPFNLKSYNPEMYVNRWLERIVDYGQAELSQDRRKCYGCEFE